MVKAMRAYARKWEYMHFYRRAQRVVGRVESAGGQSGRRCGTPRTPHLAVALLEVGREPLGIHQGRRRQTRAQRCRIYAHAFARATALSQLARNSAARSRGII